MDDSGASWKSVLFDQYRVFLQALDENDIPMAEDRISCGPGWRNLLQTLLVQIAQYPEETERGQYFGILQIKEKFGTLRIHTRGASLFIMGMIRMTESFSNEVCEVCGERGRLINRPDLKGPVRVRCVPHEGVY